MSQDEMKLDRLQARRENLFRKAQLCYDAGVALEAAPGDSKKLKIFEVRYANFSKVIDDHSEIVQEIITIKQVLKPNDPIDYSFGDAFDELCDYIQYISGRFRSSSSQNSSSTSGESSSREPSKLNIPKISLVTFDGEDLSLWPVYYENFKQLVHNKRDFSNAEKLHYLLGSLSGKSLKVCNSFEAIPDNYSAIFNLLIETYNDKKFLANLYLNKIMDFRCLSNHNPNSLQFFLEKFDTNVTALKRLKIPDLSDYLLTYLAMSKLSQETINSFELIKCSNELPIYDDLIKFVRQQSRVILKTEKRHAPFPSHAPYKSGNMKTPSKSLFAHQLSSSMNCFACNKEPHFLKDCQIFKNWPFDQKFKLVKDKNLCINCFSNKHKVSACSSKYSCNKCHLKHHTLLHKNENPNEHGEMNNIANKPSMSQTTEYSQKNHNTQILCTKINNHSTVLLGTALVQINDKWNKPQTARFLVDSGSMSNLLTVNCCKRLGFQYSRFNSNIIGIGEFINKVKGKMNITIQSLVDNGIEYPIEVLVVDKITSNLPDNPIYYANLSHLKDIPLADPTFYRPGEIDGILGVTVFTEILGAQKILGPPGTPGAIETSLGFVITGRVNHNKRNPLENNFCAFLALDSLVEKMWELENISTPQPSNENDICLKLFSETVSRDSSGRYTVALPFKSDPTQLGDSFSLAKNRFLSLELKLDKNHILRNTYHSIIEDYINQGHMSLVSSDFTEPSYFIPHHCVFKPDSVSTPCRIVFDASMKSNNNISLNDILYTGPKLQNNPVSILINFRVFPIAVNSDIKQMYRQINVIKEHRKYQKILWRFNKDDDISHYELNTVTFGVKCSPYLSLQTVKQMAKDESLLFPNLLSLIEERMYMDDYVDSFPDTISAVDCCDQLVKLFRSGQFELVKWTSNSSEFMSRIAENLKRPQSIGFDKNFLKILGLQWEPFSDMFSFEINVEVLICTKRNMLSLLARIFDPLGFLSPLTLLLKILIKKLWTLSLDWDEPVPLDIAKSWLNIQNELKHLRNFTIPRHVSIFHDSSVSLIGFSDASQSGYAAVVYVRTVNNRGEVKVTFLLSQSRVAPMSKVTLPRLELCASVLLSRLLAHSSSVINKRLNICHIYAFSDSTITLHWINSQPYKWKTFISNRIAEIHRNLPGVKWKFVPGHQNVVDCASRGLTPSALLTHSTWLSGPLWLCFDLCDWPIRDLTHAEDEIDSSDLIVENVIFITRKPPTSCLYSLIEYFSSWTKLLNSTVYVLKFIKILPRSPIHGVSDLAAAEFVLIKAVQSKHFMEELTALTQNRNIKSAVRRLNPFIKDGIIRVGGRLINAKIGYDHRHPILLPKSDPFVILLIDYYHRIYCHTGAYLMQSLIRQKYWILSSRNIIRQRIWKCNHCFRINPKPNFPLMANLPTERVNQAKAFLSTGVDFTGAFNITLGRYRGIKSQKAYVCLFICLVTKAIHLELASSLSTDCFLAAFKRFLSRRGNCLTLYSDCGTNFVGSKKKLDEIYQLVLSKEYTDAFQKELNFNKIEWKRNPPSASHFGGIWEANIKSVKSHLIRVIGTQILSYEEFLTILTQIEALLNSRPLCLLSEDPSDPVALTPAHFLSSTPLNSFPSDVTEEIKSPVNRYKLLDSIVAHYWKRWHHEYLSSLQIRQKWQTSSCPVKEGLIVIILYDNIPPLQWPLGIIEKVIPSSKDGIIRIANVRTKTGVYTRPVAKLCPLPNQ